jgi:hypothetical protein
MKQITFAGEGRRRPGAEHEVLVHDDARARERGADLLARVVRQDGARARHRLHPRGALELDEQAGLARVQDAALGVRRHAQEKRLPVCGGDLLPARGLGKGRRGGAPRAFRGRGGRVRGRGRPSPRAPQSTCARPAGPGNKKGKNCAVFCFAGFFF